MKKIQTAGAFLALVVMLSGCSLGTSSKTQSQKSPSSPSIWKSADGGKTWEVKNIFSSKSPGDIDVLNIVIDPTDSNNIYAGLVIGGIIKSTDGGETWETTSFISDKVYGLDIDPTSGKIIYASGVWQGRGKLFKTMDGGENWKEVYTSPVNGPMILAIKIDSADPRNVYMATSESEILKSSDYGATWKNIYFSGSPISKIAIDKNNSQLVYFLPMDGGLLRSKNGGNVVEDISENNELGGQFNDIDTDSASNVYSAGGSGISKSSNAGQKWEQVPSLNNPENFPIAAMRINPSNPREILYGAGQATYKSVDGGTNWSTFQFTVGKSIRDIVYDRKNPSIVYLGFKK